MGKQLEKTARWFGREYTKLQAEVVSGFQKGIEDARQAIVDENIRMEKALKVAKALGIPTRGKTLKQLIDEIQSML